MYECTGGNCTDSDLHMWIEKVQQATQKQLLLVPEFKCIGAEASLGLICSDAWTEVVYLEEICVIRVLM